MTKAIKDSDEGHWVNRAPLSVRPYLQLSRLDRPVGYWLLTLPGWIGLAFATLSHGFALSDIKWAILILIGAIAMRGAGCSYNDIVDQDLDAKVDRSALRPLPAGTVTTKQAWIWTFAQCFIGLMVLLCLPRLAQIISLCSIPLVAAYPFMKRITWWPQAWLGLTFNWAVLVAYAAKTGTVSLPLFILYVGLIFWTIGYDTIYACQDIEDDMKIGVKSTARRFGKSLNIGVALFYLLSIIFITFSIYNEGLRADFNCGAFISGKLKWGDIPRFNALLFVPTLMFPPGLFSLHLILYQITSLIFKAPNAQKHLKLFKSNIIAGFLLIIHISVFSHLGANTHSEEYLCWDLDKANGDAAIITEYCQKPQLERVCPR